MNTPTWDRVKHVFQEALERPPHERAAYVRDACGPDATIRAEVESLLNAEVKAAQLFPASGLRAGQRLGAYEIDALVGAGGMGEVYKARDTRLDRTVAIKILPPHFAADPERYERFEREARAIARLDHPHIGALYDVGEHEGLRFLVMQYLEGETLAARITKGPLPLDQALRCAIEISDALDHAHRRGVVHRDLKPGNISLTKTGAKLLDFGLAKWRPVASGVSGLTRAPESLTGEGTILGTLNYMAPEQLEGKDADARTDLFAFGVVLHEMVTGCRAFDGSSQASIVAAILDSQPPAISALRPSTPPALDHVVTRCLAKDPDERWQSARDLGREIGWIAQSATPGPIATPAGKTRSVRLWLAVTTLAVAAVAAIGVVTRYREPPVDERLIRFTIPPPAADVRVEHVSVSPDGSRIAFVGVGAREEQGSLWVRSLDSLAAQKLAGTEDASFPFWSPDSRTIAFFAQEKLKKINASGGVVQTLCEAQAGRGGAWSRNGVVIFAPGGLGGLARVSSDGGIPSALTALDPSRKESSHRWPQFLSDGEHFLYFAVSDQHGSGGLYVGSLRSGGVHRLEGVAGGERATSIYTSGYLIFERDGVLAAQRFDEKSFAVLGEPLPIGERVLDSGVTGRWEFASSSGGTVAYVTAVARTTNLAWFDRAGRLLGTLGDPADRRSMSLSPDGARVAVEQVDPQTRHSDIWILDVSRGTASRLTFDPADEFAPIWSPDGARVVFASNRSSLGGDLYQKLASGVGPEEQIGPSSEWHKGPQDWSRDGTFVLYGTQEKPLGSGVYDFWQLPLSGARKPVLFLQTAFDKLQGQFSPDGRWIAYYSHESGRHEVYVQPVPVTNARWQVSTNGASQPRWRRDGRELFFLALDGTLMAAPVAAGSTFRVGPIMALFKTSIDPFDADDSQYDVTDEGRRFLINQPVGDRSSTGITVIANALPRP